MIVAAHQTMLAPQGAPLPYDAEVEYLESTGTQYIDTGYYPSDETKVRAKFQLTRKSGYSFLGRRTGNESDVFRFSAFGQGDYFFLDYGSGNGYNRILYYAPGIQYDVLEVELGNRYIYDITHNVNTSSASVSFARKSYTFCVFSTNDNTDTGRIFNCDIYDGSTLVRSFVPVRVGTVGYLFDRVSGQLFGNAGTGAFTIGPDK